MTSCLSSWGFPSLDRGLGLGDHPKKLIKPASNYSKGAGRGLGNQLCALRASVFFVIKQRMFRLGIDKTATPSKKADDEYDYPEDLAQVTARET